MFRRPRTPSNAVEAGDQPELDETDLLMIERRRRRIVTPVTMVLGALVIAAIGVIVGANLESSSNETTAAAGLPSGVPAGLPGGGAGGLPDFSALGLPAGAGAPSGAGAAAGGGGANPFGAGGVTIGSVKLVDGSNVTIGSVKLVDGSNVYVQDASGNVTKVSTSAGATITVSKPGTVADLQVGQSVTVQGEKGKDGTVAATSITGGAASQPNAR